MEILIFEISFCRLKEVIVFSFSFDVSFLFSRAFFIISSFCFSLFGWILEGWFGGSLHVFTTISLFLKFNFLWRSFKTFWYFLWYFLVSNSKSLQSYSWANMLCYYLVKYILESTTSKWCISLSKGSTSSSSST